MTTLTHPDKPAEQIVSIEYQKRGLKWVPFGVCTDHGTYDFELTADGELMWHQSGWGGSHDKHECGHYCGAPKDLCSKLWVDKSKVQVYVDKKIATREEVRACGTLLIDEPLNGNPFEDTSESSSGFEYCIQCDGYNDRDSTCRHLKYEEGNGYTLGCGSTEIDYSETHESLYRLLRMLPHEVVVKMLKTFQGKTHRKHAWNIYTMDSMLGGDCNLEFPSFSIYCEPLG